MRADCRRGFVLLGWLALGGMLALSAAAQEAAAHRRVLEHADALVTVRYLLSVKMEGANVDREIDGEVTCVLIDADGLILCSNTELGGYVGLMSRLAGAGQGLNVTATPKEIEVVLGDGAEGLEATLLARDTDRDLAWLEVDGELPESAVVLDLTRSAELAVGEPFYRLRRMDKFFGRAPVVEAGVVGAVTTRPRRLLIPSSPTATGGFGMPIFAADGRLVGITVVQMPGQEDSAGMSQSPFGSLGGTSKMQDMVGGLILPAAEVVKATRLAREVAAEDDDE